MALPGAFSPGPIQTPALHIYVNGVEREWLSVEWAGDTTGGLPDQVASAGTGMRSRTGRITWRPRPLEVDPIHPLRREEGWPPGPGDEVIIEAEADGVTFRRFTGEITDTTAPLTGGGMSSGISDRGNVMLSRIITIDPQMTPQAEDSFKIARQAFEKAGYGLLPTLEGSGEMILHNLPQGRLSSDVGGTVSLGSATEIEDPMGFAAWTGLITPTTGVARGTRGIVVAARGSSTQTSRVTLTLDDGTSVYLSHSPSTGALDLYVKGELVVSTTRTAEGPPILAFSMAGDLVRVYRSLTQRASAVIDDPATGGVSSVRGIRMAGVQVRYTTTLETTASDMMDSMTEWPAAMVRSLIPVAKTRITRGYENVTAGSIVNEWSEATLASVWADEYGHLRAVARDRLVTAPPSRSLRVDERIFGGSWTVGEDSVYNAVMVRGDRGVLHYRNGLYRVTIHKDDSPRGFDSGDNGNPEERFIEADPTIDWGPIDLDAKVAGSDWTTPLSGTWRGAVVTRASEGNDWEGWVQVYGVTHSLDIERLGQRTLKLTETFSGIPSGERVYCKIASAGTVIDRAVRGQPTPYIRAQWMTQWAPFTRITRGGPQYADVLEIDSKWWLTPADAQRVANALAAEVTSPTVTFSNVPTLWDPRRQIGDVEDWTGVDRDGSVAWTARVLIAGYGEQWNGSVPSQNVSVRVISISDPTAGKTYNDLAAAYGTYSDLASGDKTYQQVYNALPDTP